MYPKLFFNQKNFGSENSFVRPTLFFAKIFKTNIFWTKVFLTYQVHWEPTKILDEKFRFFSTFIFDNLFIQLSNFVQLTNLPIFMEILGNYDTKTNQWVLTSKQLNLV